MSNANVSRASISPRLHGKIDAELKNLKVLGRRLQSVLLIHATELQLLKRLYYKNKNQHRGALFWRNVIEIRRLLERIEKLNLHNSLTALRSQFYSTTQNINFMKGPWIQTPDTRYLLNYLIECQKALQLVKKTAERSLLAYNSFYRSFQSAAFLQILLIFIAISSRTRTLANEINEILELIHSCVHRLSSIMTDRTDAGFEEAVADIVPESSLNSLFDGSNHTRNLSASVSLQGMQTQEPSTTLSSAKILIERLVSNTVPNGTEEFPVPVKEKSASAVARKRKQTSFRNEIDDIFGL